MGSGDPGYTLTLSRMILTTWLGTLCFGQSHPWFSLTPICSLNGISTLFLRRWNLTGFDLGVVGTSPHCNGTLLTV